MNDDKRNKLDDLPPHIKFDLHKLIKEGLGGSKIKQLLEKRYGLEMISADRSTYDVYRDIHRDELLKEKETEEANKEDMSKQISSIETWGADVAGDNSKLKEMIDFLISRIRAVVDEQQRTLVIDPRLEANLNTYINSLQKLIETAEKNKREANETNETNRLKDLDRWTDKVIDRLVDLHKKIHGEEKQKEFFEELVPTLQSILLEMARENAREKKPPTSKT